MRFWKAKKIVGRPKIGIAVASHIKDEADRRARSLQCLLWAFKAQTYEHWDLEVTHDGPLPTRTFIQHGCDNDPRVSVQSSESRLEHFGHPHRQGAIERLISRGCEWILLTNDDNYYCPVFLEDMLHAALTLRPKPGLFVYCDMVHSHQMWQPLKTAPVAGRIDLGSCIVHASLAKAVRFDNFGFRGDGDWIARIVGKAGARVCKLQRTLFMHN